MLSNELSVRSGGIAQGHEGLGWVVSAMLAVAVAAYVVTFWGNVPAYLPHWLAGWTRPVRMLQADWYHHRFMLCLVLEFAIGLVPAAGLVAWWRSINAVGLGWPNVLGRRLIAVSVLVSVPFGFWLVRAAPTTSHANWAEFRETLVLMTLTIPEHALICGTLVGLMLPGRRLPEVVPVAAVTGSLPGRALRWLGLAQPSSPPGPSKALAWFGLTPESLLAIVCSGVVFWLAHFGKPNLTEVALSLPGGIAVAYMTLRSRSIWPALIAHCTMNLVPLGLLALFH